MKIATIILFHRDPAGIERLLKALDHPDFDFYLHLDKKADIRPFAHLGSLPRTFLVKKRMPVRWAGFSQLSAILSSLDDLFASGISYDFVNLLSGQDYPIKPPREIGSFLAAHTGRSFLIAETPPTPWWSEATSRYSRYHFTDYGFKGKDVLAETLSRLLPARKFPWKMQLYGGPESGYWILSMEAARYIHSILNKRDKNWRFFKHTWAPDEFLISTLLMNSPFKETIIPDNYHYLDRSGGGPSPKILTMADFDSLRHSNKFFARKFDRSLDSFILDRIDKEILFAVPKKARAGHL